MWEKISDMTKSSDFCIMFRGYIGIAFLHEPCGYMSFVIFNHIIWESMGD